MKKILLISVDSFKFPNLPIGKLSTHFKNEGHEIFYMPLKNKHYYKSTVASEFDSQPNHVIDASDYDETYISKIYNYSSDVIIENCDNVYRGGSGYFMDNVNQPDLPSEIESCRVDYTLWPHLSHIIDNGKLCPITYGFLVKGCFRNCYFCYATKLNGRYREVNSLSKLTDNYKIKHLILYDDNFLNHKNIEQFLDELIYYDIKLLFNRGVDVRLMTDDIAKRLTRVKHGLSERWANPSISLDRIRDIKLISQKYEILLPYIKPNEWRVSIYFDWQKESFLNVLTRIQWAFDRKLSPLFSPDYTYHNKSELFKKVIKFLFDYTSIVFYNCKPESALDLSKKYKNASAGLFLGGHCKPFYFETYKSIEDWAKKINYPSYKQYLDIINNNLDV